MSIKCWVKISVIASIINIFFFYFFRSNWHVNYKWIALFIRISFIPHGSFLLPVTLLNFNGVSRWIDICGRAEYGLVHRLSLLFQKNKFIWKQHSIILRLDIFTIAVLDEHPGIKKNETSLFAFLEIERHFEMFVC